MSPLVSIITPVYNGARFLAATLDSVLRQSGADWELIVVNDGSTDGTDAILDQYGSDARVRVVEQTNGGTARARNSGLAVASGAYIAFLDADDVWPPDFLAQMVRRLADWPEAVAAYAGWQYMDGEGTPLPQIWRPDPLGAEKLKNEIGWRNALVPSGMLVRRAAVVQCQGFDAKLRTAEDWDLWLRLMPVGRFVPAPDTIILYRNHGGNKTNDIERAEQGRLIFLEKHLGPRDEPLAQWPGLRRQAVGYTYFNSALGYLRQGETDMSMTKLSQAVEHWPELLVQAELYYELGCGYQQRGFRGTAMGLRLDDSAALIQALIAARWQLLPGSRPDQLWGYACLVLAQLAATSNDKGLARRFAVQALRRAAAQYRWPALRLLAKISLPNGLAQAVRRRAGAHSR